MKVGEEIVRILEAFDLTGSYRAAGELAGCDHHTVRKYVLLRDAGQVVLERPQRARAIDAFIEKIEAWVELSQGKIRADKAHEKLVLMGFRGSDRSTRRAVAAAKSRYRQWRLRVFRPWLPEPGLWLQFDWGEGPQVDGRSTNLFCAWLAWSRYRVVIPTWDRSLATVILCLDRTFRLVGGVPTYLLTDNERTITTAHVAGVPVRHPMIARVAAHYGVTIATCVRADPESKGGSESTVKLAKADVLPMPTNLRDEYGSFAELEAASDAFMAVVNERVHRMTRQTPSARLALERQRLHAIPRDVFVPALGSERSVTNDALVVHEHARYSVPHELAQARARVLIREHGSDVVITSLSERGAREVARHEKAPPGTWRVDPSHYPSEPEGALNRRARPRTTLETEFLAIGDGATRWLHAAAETGVTRIHAKMQHAIDLASYHEHQQVAAALELAAAAGRFDLDDLDSILVHQAIAKPGQHTSALDAPSLQASTRSWDGFGR